MKIIWLADVHLEHSVKGDNLDKEEVSMLTLKVLTEHILKEKPNVVVINGDLFDMHGVIQSSLACQTKNSFRKIVVETGAKIVMVTGNHEYEHVADRYFGNGLLSAIFAGMDENIVVLDDKAGFVKLAEGYYFFGMPYRETYDQFNRDVMTPFKDGLAAIDLTKNKVFMGWHVGLPFGDTFRDNENENSWITKDHPDIKALFDVAHEKTVYLGHYHGSDTIPCGDGTFIYIGSQATRTRAESDQVKSFLIWEDGVTRRVNTHLELDKIFKSVEEASTHLKNLEARFGPSVRQIATMHVDMGEDTTMDAFIKARDEASKIIGRIKIEGPRKIQRSICEHVITKHRQDPKSTKEKMESDIFHFALLRDFRSGTLAELTDHEMYLLGLIDPNDFEKLLESAPSENGTVSELVIKKLISDYQDIEASSVGQPFAGNAPVVGVSKKAGLEKSFAEKIVTLTQEDLASLSRYAIAARTGRMIEYAVS